MSIRKPNLAKALDWLNQRMKDNPNSPRGELIDDACKKFNLNPKDSDFLWHNWNIAIKNQKT